MRTTFSVPSRKRRKRVLKQAKGFRGARSKNIRTVYDAVDKAKSHAYVGRKQKKRQYRRLWTVRINAACRMQEINYSSFMHGLKLANIEINRKMLSEMAIHDETAFAALVGKAKEAIAQ
jgi:large subunit ribosomal protein L20